MGGVYFTFPAFVMKSLGTVHRRVSACSGGDGSGVFGYAQDLRRKADGSRRHRIRLGRRRELAAGRNTELRTLGRATFSVLGLTWRDALTELHPGL